MPRPPATSAAPVCLIYGEDDFAVKHRARQVFDKWSQELGGMDHEIIDARVSNSDEASRALKRLREALQTLPFFGTGKVVWLKDCSFLGEDRTSLSADVARGLESLVTELKAFRWDNVRLLISAGKVDRRKVFYKTLDKLGEVEAHEGLSADSENWASKAEAAAAKVLQSLKKSASDEALAELVSHVGPNSWQLQNETEKLALYVGDRANIETADVLAIVTRNKQARAFALADALGNRDLPRALSCIEDEFWAMQFDKEKSEIGMLFGLISKVRAMILIKEMIREGWIKPPGASSYHGLKAQLEAIPADRLPEDKRYNPRSVHPFVLFNSMPHARKYTIEELVAAMELLLECNRKLISSQLDEKLVLQQAIVQIVRGQSAGPKLAHP